MFEEKRLRVVVLNLKSNLVTTYTSYKKAYKDLIKRESKEYCRGQFVGWFDSLKEMRDVKNKNFMVVDKEDIKRHPIRSSYEFDLNPLNYYCEIDIDVKNKIVVLYHSHERRNNDS